MSNPLSASAGCLRTLIWTIMEAIEFQVTDVGGNAQNRCGGSVTTAPCWSGEGRAAFFTAKMTLPSGETYRYIFVTGSIKSDDDLSAFEKAVWQHSASGVTFNSPGGNASKAFELGRIIRRLKLSTFQGRQNNCASACAYVFMGGLTRFAEPGSIGVHKAAHGNAQSLDPSDAISSVQTLTARTLRYMREMGVACQNA